MHEKKNQMAMESRYINPLTDYGFKSQQPIFGKVGGIAELVHMTAEERSRYNISLDSYRTNLSAMKNERAEGRKEGEAIGMQKGMQKGEAIGMQKGILSTAKKMKEIGVSSDIISNATGLSIEEVEKL